MRAGPSSSLLLLLLIGCAPPPAPAEEGRGASLYAAWNCKACHGESRQGSELAPSLAGVRAAWSRESLAAFLADPDAARRKAPRLQAQADRFPAPMPPFPKPEEERRALAAWLLAAAEGR